MHPVVSYPLALLVAICLSSVETAPGNVAQLIVPLTLAEFQFPPEVKEEEIRQNPEPRLRNAEDVQGRFFGQKSGTTILVLSLPAASSSNGTGSNTTQNVVTNVTPSSSTTTTRVDDFIRTPIAVPYPVSFPMQSPAYPMQYFRKRQDQSPAVSYPSALFGWNGPDQALVGDGGFPSLASSGGLRSPVPMVPITIGNEVRYVPLNLRMFRQLIPNQPVVRESEDLAETDDLSPFSQEVEEVNDDEDNADASEGLGGLFGHRFRQRRRRPLQNLRRVQYL
ncbi:uncharacterized protein [Drosophila bipectinata]|uniref:uncharacterized protein n=1 Tax=Drosophila bipectinata TaxID=42026 RepID=UPI001C8B099E|nr:uncharacterized protein LOC108133722 [Drosophila bipectinata]